MYSPCRRSRWCSHQSSWRASSWKGPASTNQCYGSFGWTSPLTHGGPSTSQGAVQGCPKRCSRWRVKGLYYINTSESALLYDQVQDLSEPSCPSGPPRLASSNLHRRAPCTPAGRYPHHLNEDVKVWQSTTIHLSVYFGYNCSSNFLLRGANRLARATTFGVRFPNVHLSITCWCQLSHQFRVKNFCFQGCTTPPAALMFSFTIAFSCSMCRSAWMLECGRPGDVNKSRN